ncbi:MAG: YCF48-related protein [Syntrophomonas sp.]
MNKKDLSERDICTKYISPGLTNLLSAVEVLVVNAWLIFYVAVGALGLAMMSAMPATAATPPSVSALPTVLVSEPTGEAIQGAIDGLSSGGTVYLTADEPYILVHPIVIRSNNISLVGRGPRLTRLFAGSGAALLVPNFGEYMVLVEGATNVSIQDLTVDGANEANIAGQQRNQIGAWNSNLVLVRRVACVNNLGPHAYNRAISISRCTSITIENCEVSRSRDGVFIWQSSDFRINRCRMQDLHVLLPFTGVVGAIDLIESTTGTVSYCTWNRNTTPAGGFLNNCTGVVIEHCVFRRTLPFNEGNDGIWIGPNPGGGVTVQNCYSISNSGCAAGVVHASNVTIQDCVMFNCWGLGLAGDTQCVRILGNWIADNRHPWYSGICVGPWPELDSDGEISRNIVHGYAYGITLAEQSRNFRVFGNELSRNEVALNDKGVDNLLSNNTFSTWDPSAPGMDELLHSVAFSDSLHGWAVGEGGTILHTSNRGISWNRQSSDTTASLYAIVFSNSSQGWAVGEDGTILHTIDGGDNWTAQDSGTNCDLCSVDFADESSGWAVGADGTILHTIDAGATWSPQSSGTTFTLSSVAFSDASNGWVASSFGDLLQTSDGGVTWAAQSVDSEHNLYSIAFADSLHGWVVGDSGTILHTSDGGATWGPQTSDTMQDLYSVVCTDSMNCWAVGEKGMILHTSDGGVTWSPQLSPATDDLDAYALTNNWCGWPTAYNGRELGYHGFPTPRIDDAADLSALSIKTGADGTGTELINNFIGGNWNYTVQVAQEVDTVMITVTPVSGTDVKVYLDNVEKTDGIITLEEGNNQVKVIVREPNKVDKTYNITITRGALDKCFIATAAFGSKFDWPVALLREFRDKYLLTNSLGTAFVKFYYQNSPPIAAVIAASQPLKLLVRVLLAPVIAGVYIIYHPVIMAVGLLMLIASFAVRLSRLRRRYT